MSLNKSTSYVLLHLLNGNETSAEIAKQMEDVDIRSIQRALTRLTELGLAKRHGANNAPSYSIEYNQLLTTDISDKLLEDENRPESKFNHDLITWLQQTPRGTLERLLGASTDASDHKPHPLMSAKDLEYLTVELSWKSSALEGNTYTLLDTQLLLTEGVKAKNRTEFETQMILNHKDAIGFIIENPELFDDKITFATVEELHKIIARNLGIDTGVRKKIVRISASNYTPLANPHQLRESADDILKVISNTQDPVTKSLLTLALIPYLQVFEDGNKRTGRMLANAILISTLGKGFSLRKVSARQLALAYLSFYEFNSVMSLAKILSAELAQ
jgi:Fic family protein